MSPVVSRKPYPSDISDEEWSLVVPYLTLMKEDAPQREYPLRELFNGLRYVIRYGIAWRAMPNDLPPWHAVHQQAHRWLAAGCFEALAQDLRAMLRLAAGRKEGLSHGPHWQRYLQPPSLLKASAVIIAMACTESWQRHCVARCRPQPNVTKPVEGICGRHRLTQSTAVPSAAHCRQCDNPHPAQLGYGSDGGADLR